MAVDNLLVFRLQKIRFSGLDELIAEDRFDTLAKRIVTQPHAKSFIIELFRELPDVFEDCLFSYINVPEINAVVMKYFLLQFYAPRMDYPIFTACCFNADSVKEFVLGGKYKGNAMAPVLDSFGEVIATRTPKADNIGLVDKAILLLDDSFKSAILSLEQRYCDRPVSFYQFAKALAGQVFMYAAREQQRAESVILEGAELPVEPETIADGLARQSVYDFTRVIEEPDILEAAAEILCSNINRKGFSQYADDICEMLAQPPVQQLPRTRINATMKEGLFRAIDTCKKEEVEKVATAYLQKS